MLFRSGEAEGAAVEEGELGVVGADAQAAVEAEAAERGEQVLDEIDAHAPVGRGHGDAAIGAHHPQIGERAAGPALLEDERPRRGDEAQRAGRAQVEGQAGEGDGGLHAEPQGAPSISP